MFVLCVYVFCVCVCLCYVGYEHLISCHFISVLKSVPHAMEVSAGLLLRPKTCTRALLCLDRLCTCVSSSLVVSDNQMPGNIVLPCGEHSEGCLLRQGK